MIEKQSLETKAGKAEFDEYCRSVGRFIRSRIFSPADAEELTQETITRVWQKLSGDENLRINGGYFINTAKHVLSEFYRRRKKDNDNLQTPAGDDKNEITPLPDAQRQFQDYAEQQERAIFNECLLECFEQCSLDEQVLLWRYSFDKKYTLDQPEAAAADRNFIAALLDSVRAIGEKFLPLQNEHLPVAENVRVRISRLRKRLRICASHCIARKKGF